MATRLLSDEETVDHYDTPSRQHLLNENRMKDLALSKATNLIQLLKIELQVERNSHKQSLQQAQMQLAQRYEGEVQRLREKVQTMGRQLGRGVGLSQSTQKTMRHTSFSRASSVRSFQNKKKRSVNKKYTQNQTVQSGQRGEEAVGAAEAAVLNGFCRQQLLGLQEWRHCVVVELQRLVKSQYDQLAGLINAIQACSEDFTAVLEQQPRKKGRNVVEEMASMIREQQGLINAWRAYAQDLEDLYKSASFKLQSVCSLDRLIQTEPDSSCSEELVRKVRLRLQERRRDWEGDMGILQAENSQLKNILDSMIKLVKEEKRLRM